MGFCEDVDDIFVLYNIECRPCGRYIKLPSETFLLV